MGMEGWQTSDIHTFKIFFNKNWKSVIVFMHPVWLSNKDIISPFCIDIPKALCLSSLLPSQHWTNVNYIASTLVWEIIKCHLWNQITVCSAANPAVRKALGQSDWENNLLHQTAARCNPHRFVVLMRAMDETVLRKPLSYPYTSQQFDNWNKHSYTYLAFVPSLMLWKVQLHWEGQELRADGSPPNVRQHTNPSVTHITTWTWGWGPQATGQGRRGFPLLLRPWSRSHLVSALPFSVRQWSPSPLWSHQIKRIGRGLIWRLFSCGCLLLPGIAHRERFFLPAARHFSLCRRPASIL